MIQIENVQGTGQAIALRKMVIKLGSAVVMGEDGAPDEGALASIAESVAALRERGVEVVIVSSGAIGMGRRVFPEFKARTIPDRQALAAIGQVGLMHAWKKLFNARGLRVAQMLLTREDMDDRRRYLNARYTLERLLDLGAVPIINENDTVTIDELKFGDNDQLSALVATKMGADLLVILSVVDGLHGAIDDAQACGATAAGNDGARAHRGKPQRRSMTFGSLVRVVERLDDSIVALANTTRSSLGTGGMLSKLSALRMAAQAGVHAVIACGKTRGILDQIMAGDFVGTYFVPQADAHMSGRERWIAFGRQARGRRVEIDAGAAEALVRGKKSLLAAGVCGVGGEFHKGDLVEVVGPEGRVIARGLVNFDSEALGRIRGKKSAQVREILGELEYEEVIHRDNLIVVE